MELFVCYSFLDQKTKQSGMGNAVFLDVPPPQSKADVSNLEMMIREYIAVHLPGSDPIPNLMSWQVMNGT